MKRRWYEAEPPPGRLCAMNIETEAPDRNRAGAGVIRKRQATLRKDGVDRENVPGIK